MTLGATTAVSVVGAICTFTSMEESLGLERTSGTRKRELSLRHQSGLAGGSSGMSSQSASGFASGY